MDNKAAIGFECCKNGFCFACPYNDGVQNTKECKKAMSDDVLSMLKPHVLTLEEVSHRLGEPVWVEEKGVSTVYCEVLFDVDGKAFGMTKGMIEFGNILTGHTTFSIEFYGETFRFWTLQPTEKEMGAMPWV